MSQIIVRQLVTPKGDVYCQIH